MPVEVIMPKVDMDMATGLVAQWHAREGDTVKQGEPLFDIETDKSNMEIESPATGILRQVVASNGDTVDIGVCIAQIYAEGEQQIAPRDTSRTDCVQPSDTTAGQPPDDQESNDCAGDAPATSSTDKDPSGMSGTVADKADKFRATPLARKLAMRNNVSLQNVSGSGPRGRITRHDIESAVENVLPVDRNATTQALAVASATQLDALGIAYTRVPLHRMRSTIAARLTLSKASVPHFYLECDCRMDKLQALRQELNAALGNDEDKRVSLNDLIVMAASRALEAVPDANVSWAENGIIQYHDANVSVAVSVDGGLMTPVVRAAQHKNIRTLSAEISELITRARQGKLSPQESQGGSMSITNLGMFGVQRFHAIINPPESMILAVGAASPQLMLGDDEQPTVAHVMTVCLSCDHRVLDGVVAARWLQAFRERIENPVQLML